MAASLWRTVAEAGGLDAKARMAAAAALAEACEEGNGEACELCATAAPRMLKDANVRVAESGLAALTGVVNGGNAHVLQAHLKQVCASTLERLGDARPSCRAAAQAFASAAIAVLGSAVLERLDGGWKHKNWRVRESMVTVLAAAISESGARVMPARALVATTVPLLSDGQSAVRAAAADLLVDAASAYGPTLNDALDAHGGIRPAQAKELFARMRGGEEPRAAQKQPSSPAAAAMASAPPSGSTLKPIVAPLLRCSNVAKT